MSPAREYKNILKISKCNHAEVIESILITWCHVAQKLFSATFATRIPKLNASLPQLEKDISKFHRLYAALIYFVVVVLWFVSPKLNCRVYFTISMPSLSSERLPQPPQVFISLGDPLPALLITALLHCSPITSWNAITYCIAEKPSEQARKKGIFIPLLRLPQYSPLHYKIPETPPFFRAFLGGEIVFVSFFFSSLENVFWV